MKAIDKNNLDGQYGATAVEIPWPKGLSEKARKTLAYFDVGDERWCAAYLFFYRGKYIITDESGWLTDFGTGKMDDPIGFPRNEFDRISEIEPWLETTWGDVKDTF